MPQRKAIKKQKAQPIRRLVSENMHYVSLACVRPGVVPQNLVTGTLDELIGSDMRIVGELPVYEHVVSEHFPELVVAEQEYAEAEENYRAAQQAYALEHRKYETAMQRYQQELAAAKRAAEERESGRVLGFSSQAAALEAIVKVILRQSPQELHARLVKVTPEDVDRDLARGIRKQLKSVAREKKIVMGEEFDTAMVTFLTGSLPPQMSFYDTLAKITDDNRFAQNAEKAAIEACMPVEPEAPVPPVPPENPGILEKLPALIRAALNTEEADGFGEYTAERIRAAVAQYGQPIGNGLMLSAAGNEHFSPIPFVRKGEHPAGLQYRSIAEVARDTKVLELLVLALLRDYAETPAVMERLETAVGETDRTMSLDVVFRGLLSDKTKEVFFSYTDEKHFAALGETYTFFLPAYELLLEDAMSDCVDRHLAEQLGSGVTLGDVVGVFERLVALVPEKVFQYEGAKGMVAMQRASVEENEDRYRKARERHERTRGMPYADSGEMQGIESMLPVRLELAHDGPNNPEEVQRQREGKLRKWSQDLQHYRRNVVEPNEALLKRVARELVQALGREADEPIGLGDKPVQYIGETVGIYFPELQGAVYALASDIGEAAYKQ